MTIKLKNMNAKNPFEGLCLFSNVFSNMFYVCLVNIISLVIIILWINNEVISLRPSNIKILFYFYIVNLITLTLNNNILIKNVKDQYEDDSIII